MNSDEILAELDVQYQELIQSVQLEGLSEDENNEKSKLHNGSLQDVNQIIKKYEQTLQTSREFYDKELTKLEDAKRKTESKYIESKKRIKQFENRIVKISENHTSQIATLTEQKDAEIKKLNEKLKTLTQQHTNVASEHAKFQDLQKQLEECRNEINFLYTTNEELCHNNDNLTKQLEQYPRANSVLSSVILHDDKSEILPCSHCAARNKKENNENKEEKKQIVDNEQKEGADMSASVSIFNLDDNNIKKIEKLDSCKLLTTTSSMYRVENEDNKIKQEIQRISYEFICKEKNDLLQKINKYEQKIQSLQSELFTQQTIISDTKREPQMAQFPSEKEIELENISTENLQLKQENASNQNKISLLNTELQKLCSNNNEIKEETQQKLRQICNESELSRKRLNDRHDTLSTQYMSLQTQFHETKLEYNDILSKEEQYKQEIHTLSVNIKFKTKELQQSKTGQINLRQNNAKQTEEISQLNHDIKQMFADLENTRMQSMQSQRLITTLEKQLFAQKQQLQVTRQQLQVQMQINMQNVNVMNNMQNNLQNNNNNQVQNEYNTHFSAIKKDIQIKQMPAEKQQKQTFSSISRPEAVNNANNIGGKQPNSSISLSQEKQMKSLVRGKPFLSRQSSNNIGGNGRNLSKNEQVSVLLKQRQKLETALFKLPTKPRSLEQRKKKHSIESKMCEIESQIESIKQSK